jgi:hypothetical protein
MKQSIINTYILAWVLLLDNITDSGWCERGTGNWVGNPLVRGEAFRQGYVRFPDLAGSVPYYGAQPRPDGRG